MEPEYELLNIFYGVIAVTDNRQEAFLTAEMFLKGTEGPIRENILTELENRDSRFLGWDSKYSFEYGLKSVTNDSLYLTRKVSELVRSGDFDITVTLTRRA